jgi:polyhydroxybutyrate depolymerase
MSFHSRATSAAAVVCLVGVIGTAGLRAQETKEKVTVDDVDRTYMVRLPKGYDAHQKYPVVVLLHGLNQAPDDIERLSRFDELADKDGIIAIYPAALHERWNVGVRPETPRPMMSPGRRRGYGGGYPGGGYPGGGGYPNGGGQQNPNRNPDDRSSDDDKRPAPADDVAFIGQMLDEIGTKFSVDASRVYALGLSEGGFMSMRVACNLGDRFAAVATVGAAMPKTMTCLPPRPVPVVMINGTSDPVVPYGGGTEHNLSLNTLSVEDSAKAWARIDRCADKPEKSKLPEKAKGGMETKVDTYGSCHEDAQVVLYSVKGAGNTWPGGEQYEAENAIGKTSQDIVANDVIWNFLATKKLAEQKAGGEQK